MEKKPGSLSELSAELLQEELRKYAVLLSYRGTSFCGWQKQRGPGAGKEPSIQQTLEAALSQITSEPVTVVGAGRTDAGVHAVGQVAHFVLRRKRWDPEILGKGLNSLLPTSIRAMRVIRVPIEFHAQKSALKKQYSYYFQQGPAAVPHLEPFTRWIRKPLNLEAMDYAIDALRGEHDFKPFQASGSKVTTTVRKILEAEITVESIRFPGSPLLLEMDHTLVRVRLVGTGFLKQMVRGIAGTLLQIGEGYRPASDMKMILDTGDRKLVGPTAPGRALWKERVWYDGVEF